MKFADGGKPVICTNFFTSHEIWPMQLPIKKVFQSCLDWTPPNPPNCPIKPQERQKSDFKGHFKGL